jgi:hypothetical protein
LAVLIESFCWPTEGTFKGETVDKVELAPHNYTSCGLSGLLYHKVAIIETKVFTILVHQKWEYSLLKSVCLGVGAAIYKNILAP